MLCEGYDFSYSPTGREDRVVVLKRGQQVRAYDIPGILRNEDALSAVRFYQRYKLMGMPMQWGDCPNKLVQAVEIISPLDDYYHPRMTL